jgi:hypothetical protein
MCVGESPLKIKHLASYKHTDHIKSEEEEEEERYGGT